MKTVRGARGELPGKHVVLLGPKNKLQKERRQTLEGWKRLRRHYLTSFLDHKVHGIQVVKGPCGWLRLIDPEAMGEKKIHAAKSHLPLSETKAKPHSARPTFKFPAEGEGNEFWGREKEMGENVNGRWKDGDRTETLPTSSLQWKRKEEELSETQERDGEEGEQVAAFKSTGDTPQCKSAKSFALLCLASQKT